MPSQVVKSISSDIQTVGDLLSSTAESSGSEEWAGLVRRERVANLREGNDSVPDLALWFKDNNVFEIQLD